jgi:hypothetical protein
MCQTVNAQLTSIYHELPEQLHGIRLLETAVEQDQRQEDEETAPEQEDAGQRAEPMWLLSGLFLDVVFAIN